MSTKPVTSEVSPVFHEVPTTSPIVEASAMRTHGLAYLLFSRPLGRDPRRTPSFRGQGASNMDTQASWSYMLRTGNDVGTSICQVAGVKTELFGDSLLNPSTGITTAGNSVTGAIAAMNAYKRMEASGKLESKLDVARGVIQSAAGVSFGAIRGLTIATTVQGVDASTIAAPTLLGRATYVISYVGNILFGLFFLLIGLVCAANLHSLYKLRGRLDQPGGLDTLKQKLVVTEETILRKLVKEGKDKDEALYQEALKTGVEELKRLSGELNIDLAGKSPEDMVNELFSEEELQEIGMELMIIRLQKKRETKLATILGKGTVEALKQGTATEETVRAALRTNLIVNWTLFFVGIVGFVATVLSFVFTGGVGALVLNGVFLAATIAMLGVDAFGYYQHLSSDAPPGRYDQALTFGKMGIYSLVFALGIIFTFTYGLPLLPLIVSAIVILPIIGMDIAVLAKMQHNQRQRPSLDYLREALDDEDPEWEELFNRLAKEDKKALEQYLDGEQNSAEKLREAVQQHFADQKREEITYRHYVAQIIQSVNSPS